MKRHLVGGVADFLYQSRQWHVLGGWSAAAPVTGRGVPDGLILLILGCVLLVKPRLLLFPCMNGDFTSRETVLIQLPAGHVERPQLALMPPLFSKAARSFNVYYPEFPLQWHHPQHLSPVKHLLLLFTKFLYTYKNHYGSRYKKFCKK